MHKSIRSAQKKEKRNTHTQNGGSNTSMYLHGYHANNNGIIFDIPIIIFTNSRKTQEKNNTHKYKNEKNRLKFLRLLPKALYPLEFF